MRWSDLRGRVYICVTLFTALFMNLLSYTAAKLLTADRRHVDMTLPVDAFFPFLPWTVVLYLGCFLFWAINYFTCARSGRPDSDRLFCADVMTKVICFVIFVCVPTTNIRPDVSGSGVCVWLMKMVYRVDSADNLFPSLHCAVSWLCWAGVRKNENVSLMHRILSLAMAFITCICTLTTRQHVIVDTFSGVLIAEVCYRLAAAPVLKNCYGRFADRTSELLLRVISRGKN